MSKHRQLCRSMCMGERGWGGERGLRYGQSFRCLNQGCTKMLDVFVPEV